MPWLDNFDHRVSSRAARREEERQLGMNQKGVLWWLAVPPILILALAAVILVFTEKNDLADRQVASSLERGGVVVEGSVIAIDFRHKVQLFFGKSVEVAFTTETGQRMTTWVPTTISVQEGPASVRYLRSDPSVARLVADPIPRKGRSKAVLSLYAGVLVFWVPMIIVLHLRSRSQS